MARGQADGTKDAGRPGSLTPSTGIQLGTLRLQQPLASHPACFSKIPCPPKCRAARDDAPGGIARASVHPRDKWSEEGTGSRRGQGWRAASRARAEGDVWRGTGSEEERGPRPPLRVAFGARACGGGARRPWGAGAGAGRARGRAHGRPAPGPPSAIGPIGRGAGPQNACGAPSRALESLARWRQEACASRLQSGRAAAQQRARPQDVACPRHSAGACARVPRPAPRVPRPAPRARSSSAQLHGSGPQQSSWRVRKRVGALG